MNLQAYFPVNNTITLYKGDGSQHARYTFTLAHPSFKSLYDTYLKYPKPGQHYVWQKDYFTNGAWVTATYAILFMGEDGSVIEVGDWLHLGNGAYGAFGYRNEDDSNAGLVWCPPGGLTGVPVYNEMSIICQAKSGAAFAKNGSECYSESGLIDIIPSMTVGGKTYSNVAHIVMYHGVRNVGYRPIKAKSLPLVAYGVYYRNRSEWDEYAMELWLAQGVGIIKERTPFIENASWWNLPDFVGELFSEPGTWTTTAN